MPTNDVSIIEKEFDIFDGLMTSKPDRIETQKNGRVVVRDFKTASQLSENDEENWNVDGGILGECMAGQTDTAIVDIIVKYEPKSGNGIKLVTVTLTPEKQVALHDTVAQFWADAQWRTKEAAKLGSLQPFSKNLKACSGKYGLCPYYARCWGKGKPESMLYRFSAEKPWRWALHAGGIKWQKALETVYTKLKKEA